MRSARDVRPTCYSRTDEILFDVSSHVTRRCAVKRQIPTLRADDEFFAGESALIQLQPGRAHRSFASLKAIVGGGVDYVRAQFNRADNRFGVAPIGFFIGISEISSDTN